MIIVNDLCGDEDDYFLTYEFFMEALLVEIYKGLVNLDPKEKPSET